jgi:hypothetical protein
MSVGDSIFLSSVLLALVVVFSLTGDRWNWRKIIKWGLILPGVLFALAIAGTVAYDNFQKRPTPQAEFFGVHLKSTKSDVKFTKGLPSTSLSSDKDGWLYPVPTSGEVEGWYRVGFSGEQIRFVMFLPVEGHRYNVFQPSLLGFKIGSTYDEVIEKLGPPSFSVTSADELRRMLSYEKFNVFFGFSQGQIEVYGIYDPAKGPVKFSGQ